MRWDFSSASLEPMPKSRCVCHSRNAKVVGDLDGCSENKPAHVENSIVFESVRDDHFWRRHNKGTTSLAELSPQWATGKGS